MVEKDGMEQNEIVDTIVKCMAAKDLMSDLQRIQTEHRFKLAKFWDIKEGKRVLEVGCGQGDTTAVLAYFVGENGFVHGIDIGPPTYGGPITLGDSINYLKKSRLGKQINVDFEIDLLSPEIDFPEDSFDYIVLSHCSWYFKSFEEGLELLKKVRKWGKTLCFAEWDTKLQTIEQYPHLLSVLIQAQYESFKLESDSNIRTLFTIGDIKDIARNAGWNIRSETNVYSPHLQDGEWEVNKIKSEIELELKNIHDMPSKMRHLIDSEVRMLRELTIVNEIKPLSVFAFTADKIGD